MDDITLTKMAQQRLEALCQEYGIRLPTMGFDLRGKNAGMAYWPQNHIRLNLALFRQNIDAFIASVIPHELCHIWQYQLRLGGRPHGPEWQRLMLIMGVHPQRTHQFDTSSIPARRLQQFAYRCACRRHILSSIRHHRASKGLAYRCLRCKSQLVFESAVVDLAE